jgi:hypothetical protein
MALDQLDEYGSRWAAAQELAEIKRLTKENADLREANRILKARQEAVAGIGVAATQRFCLSRVDDQTLDATSSTALRTPDLNTRARTVVTLC